MKWPTAVASWTARLFRLSGPHASELLLQSPSQTHERQRRNSASKIARFSRHHEAGSARRGEAPADEYRFSFVDAQGSAQMEGLRARPVKLPKPGLALEHLPTGLTHTKGRKSTHSQRKLKLAKLTVPTRSTSFCPELPALFLSALVPHGELHTGI